MSSLQRIVITSPLTAVGFSSECNLAPGQLPALQNLTNYLESLAGGNQSASLAIKVGAVQASGTITQTSTGAANAQTCTICGVTFTAVTSGHAAGQASWNRSNTVATSATNLAQAINDYVAFQGMVSATAALGVVTVTAVVPGKIGNGLVMANVDLANTTFSSFASGTDGTAYTLNFS